MSETVSVVSSDVGALAGSQNIHSFATHELVIACHNLSKLVIICHSLS